MVLRWTVRGSGGASPDGRRRLPTGDVRRSGRISGALTGSPRTWLVASFVLASALSACTKGPEPAAEPHLSDDGVVIASFNFAESELVAEIYAGALEAAGVPVRREFALGPRELVQPALLQGLVDVVPEYLGTSLSSLAAAPGVDLTDPGPARQRLADVLSRWDVRVLDPSPGQNQNGFVVTRALADRLGLRTVSDLSRMGADLVVGGPPECPQRPHCLKGLDRTYHLSIGAFVPFLTERQRVTALREDVVNVAVMFTTDGELAGGDLVLLDDDRRLQPAENLVPLVSADAVKRFGPKMVNVLNAVSSQLTDENLRFLNWRVSVAGNDADAEARAWLKRHALAPRP